MQLKLQSSVAATTQVNDFKKRKKKKKTWNKNMYLLWTCWMHCANNNVAKSTKHKGQPWTKPLSWTNRELCSEFFSYAAAKTAQEAILAYSNTKNNVYFNWLITVIMYLYSNYIVVILQFNVNSVLSVFVFVCILYKLMIHLNEEVFFFFSWGLDL